MKLTKKLINNSDNLLFKKLDIDRYWSKLLFAKHRFKNLYI